MGVSYGSHTEHETTTEHVVGDSRISTHIFLGSTVKYVQSGETKESQDEDWRAGRTLVEMKWGFTRERKKGR